MSAAGITLTILAAAGCPGSTLATFARRFPAGLVQPRNLDDVEELHTQLLSLGITSAHWRQSSLPRLVLDEASFRAFQREVDDLDDAHDARVYALEDQRDNTILAAWFNTPEGREARKADDSAKRAAWKNRTEAEAAALKTFTDAIQAGVDVEEAHNAYAAALKAAEYSYFLRIREVAEALEASREAAEGNVREEAEDAYSKAAVEAYGARRAAIFQAFLKAWID